MVKPTDSPLWQAASPRPRATCVLPVPLLPTAITFSRQVDILASGKLHDQDACSQTALPGSRKCRGSLTAGKRAALILRSTMR